MIINVSVNSMCLIVLLWCVCRSGEYRLAWQLLLKAGCLECNSTARDPAILSLLESTVCALMPRWHFPMVNDSHRNQCFKSAIENALAECHSSDASMIDIGCGTGLLR